MPELAFCHDAANEEKERTEFRRLTRVLLSPEEAAAARRPDRVSDEKEFLAVHWHPEWAPLGLIDERLRAAFPKAESSLVIPTQHNKVMRLGEYAGVEADVYAHQYKMKVQLLIHFKAERLQDKAGAFVDMMNRTYNYRAHQLMELLDCLLNPDANFRKALEPLKRTIAPEAIEAARYYAGRLKTLIEEEGVLGSERDEMLKNRLLPDFIGACCQVSPQLLEQLLYFVGAVKKLVKADLRPEHFYTPEEVIEEARSFGAGVVIPHPPLFWPILISDLDVDGWEVWNPSSPHHTVFLIEALARRNARAGKNTLAFMGDDTHMSAKLRENYGAEKAAAGREIGFQPPWFEEAPAAALKAAGQSRTRTLNEYRAILG